MKPVLNLNQGFTIDLGKSRWQTQGFRGAVAGSSGSGKSHLVTVFCEELARLGIPFLVIDPDGEYRALQTLAGATVHVFGHRPEDEPLDYPQATGWLDAIMVHLEAGAGVVADISGLHAESEQRRAYTWLLGRLWQVQYAKRQAGVLERSLFLVVEEAHIFAPQKRQNDPGSLDVTVRIAKRGRKYGIFTIFASQRPGDLEKDILGQANIRFIGRLDMEHDFKAVESLLPSQYRHKNFLELDAGDFYLRIGPNFHKVRVRQRYTPDLAKTPPVRSGRVEQGRLL